MSTTAATRSLAILSEDGRTLTVTVKATGGTDTYDVTAHSVGRDEVVAVWSKRERGKRPAKTYTARILPDGGFFCDCDGHRFGGGQPCRHVAATLALLARRRLRVD